MDHSIATRIVMMDSYRLKLLRKIDMSPATSWSLAWLRKGMGPQRMRSHG